MLPKCARLVMPIMTVFGLVAAAHAEPREVTGLAGVLGEWELTANVTERISGSTRELAGPLNLKHVGICTIDGPEQKNGELRLRISGASTRVTGTLLIEGTECSYSADLRISKTGS